jgi:thiosulfate reductase cytochrome b subunit
MNCFLCHTATPDNMARVAELEANRAQWASSAALQTTSIIQRDGDSWVWNTAAFNADGTVSQTQLGLQDPSDAACGACHGTVHSDARTPLILSTGASNWETMLRGQVFSSQRIFNSGLNIADKNRLTRTWDVHAERVVGCTDCHYALNNPVFDTEPTDLRPEHLQFDPRRMDFGEYLNRPLHQFANSDAATESSFGGAQRPCESCHEAVTTHAWLPYTDRHLSAVACETCHIPQLYAPALESVDWTVLHTDGSPLLVYRGFDGALITGFQPVLLTTQGVDGAARLAPYNLIARWYWAAGAGTPVPESTLRNAWLIEDAYVPEILAALDANRSGTLDDAELALETQDKVELIAARLTALGVVSPQIVADVQPYAIHHNVIGGEWATRECSTCHANDTRLAVPITVSHYLPGGVTPTLPDGQIRGTLTQGNDGVLYFQTQLAAAAALTEPVDLYVLGHHRVVWVDLVGVLMFLSIALGASIHGGLRYWSARRMTHHVTAEVREVYMYSVYERQWHWLQTAAIFGLLFTGLVIHQPDLFSMFDFQAVVLIHNALAVVLVLNAALALFYHLASGEIQQYLPRPYGFFDQMFAQAKYYLWGIFRGAPHPFAKTPQRKLNPLQQMTYFAILNVLLPLQIITGALMWGAQHFPALTAQLGGLGFLAPFHSLIAWSFGSFIVLHVYLTTTGHTPASNIKAMMLGWDETELQSPTVPTSTTPKKEGA